MQNSVIGIITETIGHDPLDRHSWSGSSYFFFTELSRRRMLHRAFGAAVSKPMRLLYIMRNFRLNRKAWRKRFYIDVGYRRALTDEVRRNLGPEDEGHPLLQIGGMCDLPRLTNGRVLCYSFHDSNLAESSKSPHFAGALDPRTLNQALEYERQVCNGTARIFTASDYLRRSFIANYGVPPDRVTTIGCGMNLDTIPPPPAGKRYDTAEILFIGIEFARKGGWELLQAFRRVRQRFPTAKLHIVGPHELSIPPELQGGIVFHGFLNKQVPADLTKLEDLFKRCCLFVMPSLYEPFGIAPLEAMVHHIPAIVTNAWALPEVVTPGETGALVECGSVEDLGETMSALLADPETLRRMGEAGRRQALERFTWQRVVGRMLDMLCPPNSSPEGAMRVAPAGEVHPLPGIDELSLRVASVPPVPPIVSH
jgi:starch synthase